MLLGHNGSGKTTLLRIAAGLLDATRRHGRPSLGHPAGSLEARAFTQLPRRPAGVLRRPHRVGAPRVHRPAARHRRLGAARRRPARAPSGSTDRGDDLPTTFSRGLRQKAAIALAFVRPFELLLVDEPFVGLDQPGREALLELFDRAHGDGATLVVATHELDHGQRRRARRRPPRRRGDLRRPGRATPTSTPSSCR